VSKAFRDLERFENTYRGRKALIIGNGPSADYARVAAERCDLIIGVNAVEMRDLGVKLDWLVLVDPKRSFEPMEKAMAVVDTKADHIAYKHGDWAGEWGNRGVRLCTQGWKPGRPWPWVYAYENRRLHPPVLVLHNGAPVTAACMAVYFGVASIEFIGTDYSDPIYPKAWPHYKELWQAFAKEHAPPSMELINLPPGTPEWVLERDLDDVKQEYRYQFEKESLVDPFPTVTRKLPGDDQ
jgi:hypothetical protein